MKEVIKHYFPLVLTALCAIFAVYTLLHSLDELNKIFAQTTQQNNKTLVAESLASRIVDTLPTPAYIGGSLSVGEGYDFDSLFLIDSKSDTALYLIDVKSSNKESVLTKLTSTNINALSQVPSAALYDTEKHRLYFYNSGIYTLLIRFYYNHQPGVLYECEIPVEAR